MQHGATGENPHRVARGILQDVADVGVGVTGGVHDLESERPDVNKVAVGHRAPLVTHVVTAGDNVFGTDCAGQFEAAGDVVVVDVGFKHVSDCHGVLVGEVEHSVDVALRIDDRCDAPVADQIAPVS